MKTIAQRNFGLATRLMILAAVMLVFGVVTIWVAVQFELVSLNMALLALIVCVVSTQIAHVAGEFPSGDDYFMARLAASMFARTCLPFLVVIFVKLNVGIPFEPGFVFFVILFYLVGLLADVALQVWRVKPAN